MTFFFSSCTTILGIRLVKVIIARTSDAQEIELLDAFRRFIRAERSILVHCLCDEGPCTTTNQITSTAASQGDRMVKIALLLIILAVVVGIVWQRRSSYRRRPRTRIPPPQITRDGPARQLEALQQNRNYWGVEIQSGICEASKALADKQFPSLEAPSVPLVDCSASSCTCRYMGLWERRKWHRRTQPDRRKMIRYTQNRPDRRCHKERRKADVWSKRSW